ncbi:MAG: carboxymuconolactone decarboxylase family protein [Candidatus Geothermarchaeales archaeon]
MREKPIIEELPKSLQDFVKRYPDIWRAYERLGEACTKAGPLGAKEVELIKMVIYGMKQLFTPFKTHVRLALREGASREEIEHAIVQLLTAEGLSTTVMAMKWADEVTKDEVKKRKKSQSPR